MNFISVQIKNLPYKKMSGYLKSQKINPNLVAISISDDGLKYIPIDWKNYLSYGHKVVKIVLCKMNSFFLFVGYSMDDKTIVYNNNFSEIVLNQEIKMDQIIISEKESTTINETKMGQSDMILDKILDKIGQFGIISLTDEERKELNELSKK